MKGNKKAIRLKTDADLQLCWEMKGRADVVLQQFWVMKGRAMHNNAGDEVRQDNSKQGDAARVIKS